MQETWGQIDAWLQANAPKVFATLQPGASSQTLDQLESRLGFPISAELRDHLAVHDGQPSDTLLGLLHGWIFLGSDSIAGCHATFARLLREGDLDRPGKSRDGAVKPVWWSDRWIPLVEGPGGDYLCIDMDPAGLGRVGQVITFWHAEPFRRVEASSLGELLARFLRDLGEDVYEVTRNGGLWPA
jgi:cell wall assembly regulator SMI1